MALRIDKLLRGWNADFYDLKDQRDLQDHKNHKNLCSIIYFDLLAFVTSDQDPSFLRMTMGLC